MYSPSIGSIAHGPMPYLAAWRRWHAMQNSRPNKCPLSREIRYATRCTFFSSTSPSYPPCCPGSTTATKVRSQTQKMRLNYAQAKSLKRAWSSSQFKIMRTQNGRNFGASRRFPPLGRRGADVSSGRGSPCREASKTGLRSVWRYVRISGARLPTSKRE
jgi:hypothetical protein